MDVDRRAFLGAATVVAGSGALVHPASGQIALEPPRLGPATKGVHPQPGREPLDARSAAAGTATAALAAHVVGLQFSDIDAATLAKAKHRVLDLVGCAIGGAPAEGNAALARLVQSSGAPEASVMGYGVRGPAAEVALANAVISRSFDFEVMTVNLRDHEVASHHAPTTVMTALALSEQHRLSGKAFLTALIIGDDVAARTLAAAGLDFANGWDGSPLYGALGGVAIASRLEGLSADQCRNAFGLAVDQVSGTVQSLWDGATNWKLQQGTAARSAIFCARLAKAGWTGMNDALLAPYGFFAQYSSGCAFPEVLTTDLGEAFFAEEYFKPFPSCAANHPSIECALALRERHGLKPSDIARITVKVQPGTLRVFVAKPFAYTPSAHCQANFSLPFSVATALLRGGLRQEDYADDAMRDPELVRLINAVSLEAMAPGTRGVRIAVTTRDGQILSQDLAGQASRYPRERPSTYDEIVAKFRQQVSFSRFVNPADADEIIRRVAGLENERDMAQFARLLTRSRLSHAS